MGAHIRGNKSDRLRAIHRLRRSMECNLAHLRNVSDGHVRIPSSRPPGFTQSETRDGHDHSRAVLARIAVVYIRNQSLGYDGDVNDKRGAARRCGESVDVELDYYGDDARVRDGGDPNCAARYHCWRLCWCGDFLLPSTSGQSMTVNNGRPLLAVCGSSRALDSSKNEGRLWSA